MRKLSKALSIVLGFACILSMLACAGTSNALEGTVETKTTSVSLTFDGLEPYGIPSHRGLTTINYDKDRGYLYLYNKANNGGTFYIGKNGTVGENPVTQRSSDETLKNNARNDLFYCEAGKTYRLKYDYKYLAGSGGVGRTMSIWLLPDPLAASISDYDLAKRATLIDSSPATCSFGDTSTVLTEDTEWQTAYYTFTVKADQTEPLAIGMHPGWNGSYDTYLAIDNLTVQTVTSYEYGESRLHTMDDTAADAYITASGCTETSVVTDGEHGSVLKLVAGNIARLGFEDFKIKENRKYYIYYDARSESDDTGINTIIGLNGSNTVYCRYFFTGWQTSDLGVELYIDGTRTTYQNFKMSKKWARYGIVIDTSDPALLADISSYQSNFWSKDIHFLFGANNATVYFDNLQIIEIETVDSAVADEQSIDTAYSIRTETKADDNTDYVSAGLRFRGIISNDIKAKADEIGFVAAPSHAVGNNPDWYKLDGNISSYVRHAACYKKGTTDVVYSETNDQTAYQLILTGLSSESGKNAYYHRFSSVMYVRTGGTYSYYTLGEVSWYEITARYRVMNIDYDAQIPVDFDETPSSDWKKHPQDYKLIALTFDDGPTASDASNPSNPQVKIINTLKKYCGAGTMFITGISVNKYGTDQLQYALDNGFELGNHTYTHANISSGYLENRPGYSADDYINEQIKPLNDKIKDALNYDMKFVRASNLTTNNIIFEACSTVNMPLIAGNQDVNGGTNANTAVSDWSDTTTEEHIYNAVVNYAYDGKIVLMHGTSATTASVLDRICKQLYSDGYRFVTLSELFQYKLAVSDMSQVDVKNSVSGNSGSKAIYDIDDVKLKYYNDNQWFLHPEDYKLIAFTFDDGPVFSEVGNNVTTKIIDSFDAYYGAATFFFTGRGLRSYGAALPEYAMLKGHELANHSDNHSTLSEIENRSETEKEIKNVNAWYKENLGYDCKFFRGGGYSENQYMWNYLSSIKMPAIASTIALSDYPGGVSTKESIVNALTAGDLKSGSIIGCHSTNKSGVTLDALAEVLPALYEKGYRFCTLSQLLELQGVDYDSVPTDKYIKGVFVTNGSISYN